MRSLTAVNCDTNPSHPQCSGGGSAAGPFGFIGYTNDVTNLLADAIDGGQGMLAMHALCQDDFGAAARMCTSKEFWLSPNAEAPSTNAWIHVSRPQMNFTGFDGNFNCKGWTDAVGGRTGTVVTTDGKPNILNCNALVQPVTCCTPLQ